MERKKGVVSSKEEKTQSQPILKETLPTWKKIGGGTLWLKGHMIKPGETFKSAEKDIPEAFRDMMIPWDGTADSENAKQPEPSAPILYSLEKTSDGKYNVVNGQGKAINETPIEKEAAEELVESLNG